MTIKTGVLPKFKKREKKVYYKKTPRDIWRQGQIVDEVKDRSYTLQSTDGSIYRRNRVHIRPTKVDVNIRDLTPTREQPHITPCRTIGDSESTSVFETKVPTDTGQSENSVTSSLEPIITR